MDDDAGTMQARDPETGGELASLGWEATGEWREPDALANFAIVRRLFEMPTISESLDAVRGYKSRRERVPGTG